MIQRSVWIFPFLKRTFLFETLIMSFNNLIHVQFMCIGQVKHGNMLQFKFKFKTLGVQF